ATGAGGTGASPWAAGARLAWDVTVIAAKRDNRPFRLRPGVVRDESRARCRHILDRNSARHAGRSARAASGGRPPDRQFSHPGRATGVDPARFLLGAT